MSEDQLAVPPSFSFSEQYHPWDRADLEAIERASSKRQREEDITWLQKYGLDEDIFEVMAAVDAQMGEETANTQNTRARSQEMMDQRKQALDNEPDAFKTMMMKHVWDTEESNENLKVVMETTRADIKKIDGTLKDHS